MHLNPYYIGYQLFKDIERRWNGEPDEEGEFEEDWLGEQLQRPIGQGRERIFQVRREDDDQSFLRKYLTERLVRRMDLFTYRLEERNGEFVWVVQETDWRKVRDALVAQMTNLGAPYVTVEDGDFERRGELLLLHHYDGRPLDYDYTVRTLRNLVYIWGRPVHIETVANDESIRISCDGENNTDQHLGNSRSPASHRSGAPSPAPVLTGPALVIPAMSGDIGILLEPSPPPTPRTNGSSWSVATEKSLRTPAGVAAF